MKFKSTDLVHFLVAMLPGFLITGGIYTFLSVAIKIHFSLLVYIPLFLLITQSIYLVLKQIKLNIWHVLILLLVSIIQSVLLYSRLNDFYAPSHNHDASNHYYFTQSIIKSGYASASEALKELSLKLYDGNNKHWYPLGFHTSQAVFCELTGETPCIRSPWFITILLVSTWLITVYYFVLAFFKDSNLAFFSGLLSITFFLFPYTNIAWGQWGILSGQFLSLWCLIFAVMKKNRRNNLLVNLCLAIGLVALFYIHPTSFLSTLMLLFLFILIMPIKRQVLISALITLLIVGILSIPGFVESRADAVGGTENPIVTEFSLGKLADLWVNLNIRMNNNLFIVLFLGTGGLVALRNIKNYRYRLVIIVYLIMFTMAALLAFSKSFSSLFAPIFPWGQPERIISSVTFLLAVLAGIGMKQVYEMMRSNIQKAIALTGLSAFVLFTFFTNVRVIATFNDTFNTLTKEDMLMFAYISENVPKEAIIYQNPRDDSGIWLNKFTDNTVVFPISVVPVNDKLKEKIYLLMSFPAGSVEKKMKLEEYGIEYIYRSEGLIPGGVDYIPLKSLNEDYIQQVKCIENSCLYRVLL